jgi:putative transcriptional regulator
MAEERKLRNRVKPLRMRLNLSQSDLAREVGITRQSIISIEKGKLNPSIVVCLKIARVLREPVDYVFYLEPPKDLDGRPHEVPDEAEEELAEAPRSESGDAATDGENRGIWDFV